MQGDLIIRPSTLSGEVNVPGSKSHTIRAMLISSLSEGVSVIRDPLISKDTLSCRRALEEMGVPFSDDTHSPKPGWRITGIGGRFVSPDHPIHVGNSGTTLRLLTGAAALTDRPFTFDGDESLRRRPMQPLLSSLYDLGATVSSSSGYAPLTVTGPLTGGQTMTDGFTSQFLSSLLLSTPLALEDSEIDVIDLHERPYIDITLQWLNSQGIRYRKSRYRKFKIQGRQSYTPFSADIPGDFSTATFHAVAAAVTCGSIKLAGLNMKDSQGDKEVFRVLKKMGAGISREKNYISIKGGPLRSGTFDLNDIPDSLPALAVAACSSKGETRLVNVEQARYKESDRIRAMYTELKKMGAEIEELDQGLVIQKSQLQGTEVNSYNDHRIAMALSIAGLIASGETVIKGGAGASEITYPSFVSDFQKLGADIRVAG